MSYELNNFSCISDNCGNTGMSTCTFKPGFTGGLILGTKGKVYTKAEIAAIVTTLQAAAADDSPANRIYPIKPFTTVEAADSEAVYETAGQSTFFVKDGKLGLNARIDESECLWKKHRKFNDKQNSYDAIIIDTTNNSFQGVKVAGGWKGYTLDQIAVPQPKQATTSNVYHHMFKVVFKYISEFENSAHIQLDSSLNVLDVVNGLIDFNFVETAELTNAGVYSAKLMGGCGTANLGDLFATELADPALFTANIDATGVAVTIASITYSTATEAFTFTFTLPLVGVLPVGGTFTVNAVAPSDLAAADVPGYSGCSIQLTRPA